MASVSSSILKEFCKEFPRLAPISIGAATAITIVSGYYGMLILREQYLSARYKRKERT